MTATSAERRVFQFNWARLTLHRESSTMEGTVRRIGRLSRGLNAMLA